MQTPMKILGAGKRNHLTDVAGLLVGNAEDARLKSGVTVVTSRLSFACGVAVMGGAPGTRETDLLSPASLVEKVDALVLAGGSAYGLAAATGVMAGLAKAGHGLEVIAKASGVPRVPIVPSAILFDLANGGDKAWRVNPYADLGRRALEAASDNANLGSWGVGTGAVCAEWKGGRGAASLVLGRGDGEEEIVVAALVASNPFGSVLCPRSKRFWAGGCEIGEEFGGWGMPHRADPLSVTTKATQVMTDPLSMATKATQIMAEAGGDGRADSAGAKASRGTGTAGGGGGGNTVIGVVATDLALGKAGLTRLALMAQAGIARAVYPSHTPLDGDVVFAVSTGAKKLAGVDSAGAGLAGEAGGQGQASDGAGDDRGLAEGGVLAMVGHAGAVCVSRAVARGVYLAESHEGDTLPTAREMVGK